MEEMQNHENESIKIEPKIKELTPKIEHLKAKANISPDLKFEYLPTISEEENSKNELVFALIEQNNLLKKQNEELKLSLDYAKKSLRDSELEITLRKAEMEARNVAIRNSRIRGIGEGALAVVLSKATFEMFRK